MTQLVVSDLAKSFPSTGSGRRVGTRAVDGVTLHVNEASLTAVLGPSGCGKTTLLRLIAGFLRPDAGTIEIDGREVASPGVFVPPQERHVGYVPQEGALFPHLDVAANIAFGLPRAERRTAAGKARVAEILDLVELPQAMASRQPHELSGGQQPRVAVARALAPHPRVVLLDEPFSSLDAGLREATGRAVRAALTAAHTTAVLVTHHQDEALSLADQVAVMREGRLLQATDPVGLYHQPADVHVARFVGGAVTVPAVVVQGEADCALGRVTVTADSAEGEVLLLVRPEQVRLGEVGSGVTAEVQEVAFYGHDAAVRLRLGDLALVSRVEGAKVPTRGSLVGVRVEGPVIALPDI